MRDNHGHHGISGKKLTWAIFFNLGITAAEFIGGLVSGYVEINNMLCDKFGIGHGTIQLEISEFIEPDMLCHPKDHVEND